jgi:hypothetical protein
MRFAILLAIAAFASAFQGHAVAPRSSKIAASRFAAAPVAMADEPSEKAVVIGAASVGGVLGVYLFHELSTGLLLASVGAYVATLGNSAGSATKVAGSTAAKAFSKALELNEQYDVLPKTKGALDTVSIAAGNLNENYGITDKIDAQLKISDKLALAGSKVDELKSSVSDKLDDLKTKASKEE